MENKRRGIKIPHMFTLMLLIIAVCTILTYIIPAGQYDTYIGENGIEMLVDGSYHRVEQTPVTPMQALMSVQEGLIATAYISAFIFIIGGAFGVVGETKAIEAGIGRIIKKTSKRQGMLIPIMIFVVGFGAGSFGMFEECLVFIPFLVPICIAMGYDSITGLAIAIVGSSSGYAGSFIQPANVGVAQSIAGLPMYSAMGYRIIILLVMLTIATLYIYFYTKRIKKDPTRSLMYEFDRQREEKVDIDDLPELTTTRKLVLLVMGATFALLIVGVLKWGWYINELSALFLGMGIVVGFVGRVGFDGFGKLFARGVSDFAGGALAVGFARGILIVLTGGNILHTILYAASGVLTALPTSLTAMGMYVLQNFLNLLIPSATGQAATSLPILLPMGDMAGITRQTTCIIFQIGNGLSNILVPTSGTFMVALSMAKVPYGKWAKWFLPLLGLQFLAGAILVLIANAIQLGPL